MGARGVGRRVLVGLTVLMLLAGCGALASPPPGTMPAHRGNHTATLLADGRVLLAGGHIGGSGVGAEDLVTAVLYDPTSGTFSTTGSLATGRSVHTATLLPDGRVLLAGAFRVMTL